MDEELISFFQRLLALRDWHDSHGASPTKGVGTYVSRKTLNAIEKALKSSARTSATEQT